MGDPVIRVENLSKKYVLSHQQDKDSHKTLRDAIAAGASSLLRPIQNPKSKIQNPGREEFWALKDVSFEIKQGDRVGIIGRNGAGKSTLLKILSRIVEPTTGRIRIKGRVASLLEVGTGFHPELTGRENIFLNGAILGMSKTEIQRKFDEIVAFAEIEKFLDTPVKRYSSGMYVRLAFAVAAHLEPEILIVDEVLAVGDASFQKKCLGKMEEVGKEGRTVIFVSHHIGSIRSLCSRAILLEKGRSILDATTEKVLHSYLSSGNSLNGYWKRSDSMQSSEDITFTEVRISNQHNVQTGIVSCIEPFFICVHLNSNRDIDDAQIHIRIINQEGIPILTTSNTDSNGQQIINRGSNSYRVKIPPTFLSPGNYTLVIAAMIPKTKLFDVIDSEVQFSIEDIGSHATGLQDGRLGVVTLVLDWQLVNLCNR